ncbi:hypothetical protein [Sunxiuqinia sp. sy24]|uniref:hypothetical protein n=1 Tax=Sunxiuqinia sp. sy24 TaxID=3461495 RepID=UPI004045C613
MINISLTDFIDYVSKVGTSKFTIVNQIYSREEYQPAFDFWKPLREGIIDLHQHNRDKSELDKILNHLTDKKKINRYPSLIESYKSFLGRKKVEWFEPPFKDWKTNDLRIKLNPELGLEINDKLYVIKLYFKADKLSQMKADLILLLMNTKLKKGDYKEATFAVLDVERKKLFEKTKLKKTHLPLLEGEALSFINIWNSFEK